MEDVIMTGLAHETFTLTLDKVLQNGTCPQKAKNASCVFTYIWDFPRNMGLAHLISIDGTDVNITLHPLGITGMLAFMSDMKPTTYNIGGQNVVIYRVILDLPTGGERQAGIMWNENGSCITTTNNWIGVGLR